MVCYWARGRARFALALAVSLAITAPALTHPPRAVAQAAAVPAQQDVKVTSFDGTQLDVNFYPATGLTLGQTAPTVLEGSGWGAPAYPDSLPTISSIGIGSFQFALDQLGPATLNADGYNVVTWDARGWYASGGQVEIDSPYYEGRDVSAIINWLATLPGVRLKGPNDPVVGMTGASYGGGVQLSAAAIDHRLDAIEPNMSWYSLVDSLYPNQVIKAGLGNLLCLAGDLVGARYAPVLTQVCASAMSGDVVPSELAAGEHASPGPLMGDITTPTLLLAGTVDTLFPINGDIDTYEALRAAGTPVKMMWYCGGHGICNQNVGPSSYVSDIELAWLNKYLKGENVSTGPGFEYLDQAGTWRSAPSYPVAPNGQLTASGSGYLWISPLSSSGFFGIAATKASNAVNIPLPAPSTSVETLSDPQLTLTYRGTGTVPNTPIFAQLLDNSTGTVLDNQATPIPLLLDGGTHTVTVPLNLVTWNLTPSSNVTLQLTDSSDLFFAQHSWGLAHLQAKLTLATAPPGPAN
jgi:ABC-2 type transport system ATP-binding protein